MSKRDKVVMWITWSVFLAMVVTTGLAFAKDWYWSDGMTGGAARDLDAVETNNINNGDLAIVADADDSGNSVFYIFKFDANRSDAEQTTTSPRIIRPDDFSAAGVWVEHVPARRACSLSATFTNAESGDSVFVVSPWGFAMTGVSMFGIGDFTAGVSILKGSGGIMPVDDGSDGLADISGSGNSVYSISGTTEIAAGDILTFEIGTLATAGVSTFVVQIFGLKK